MKTAKKQIGLKLSEGQIQRTCEDFLKINGWRIFRLEMNYSERKRKVIGEAGAPDCMAVRYLPTDREILFIEWKSAKGKPSLKQLDWHRNERSRGAMTVIAGVDFKPTPEDFIQWYKDSGL